MDMPILYLDQNYMSNLAKAKYQSEWKHEDRDFWEVLSNLLLVLTGQNRLICPASYFHEEESERGVEVRNIVWQIGDDLSRGLSFRHWTDVMFDQFEEAARFYAGVPTREEPSWSIPFHTDPASLVESSQLSEEIQFRVKVPYARGIVDYLRKGEAEIQEKYREFKKALTKLEFKSFEEELTNTKLLLLKEVFAVPRPLVTGPSELDRLFSVLGGTGVINHLQEILEIVKDIEKPEDFLESVALLDSQFLHIRASLMTADIRYYPEKMPDRGMNTDFNIIATVLPYVDLIATDAYVKELIRRSDLVQRFQAQIFSARLRDREELLKVLEALRG